MKRKRYHFIVLGGAAVIILAAVILLVVHNAKSAGSQYGRHMELAQQYLDELNYEQAIAELRLAISIDPKCEEAYLALADIYVELGNYEEAVAVLEECCAQTEGAQAKDMLKEIRAQQEKAEEDDKGEVTDGLTEEDADAPIDTGDTADGSSQKTKTVLEKMIFYDPDGSIRGWFEWEYNSAGYEAKESYHDSSGIIRDRYEYEYDSAGNKTKYTLYDPDGILERGLMVFLRVGVNVSMTTQGTRRKRVIMAQTAASGVGMNMSMTAQGTRRKRFFMAQTAAFCIGMNGSMTAQGTRRKRLAMTQTAASSGALSMSMNMTVQGTRRNGFNITQTAASGLGMNGSMTAQGT